ncbi:hypothetical protein CR162_18645 [Pseudoroseomonas rhizosphaerae]|uniref:Uncharacterized protein n=1 Tax=Teichococcus rhizosphaerae TaxID=1335062 RepID=A0A2C6XY08_9PROT|nr:hypothetical protein [Pseudoroseomonas rhizosphaerae]PHK93422.1 hypothetical protein CR162_18645 [Pseudoroseomonas rhizosphaerae]
MPDLMTRVAGLVAGTPRELHQKRLAEEYLAGGLDIADTLPALYALHASWDARREPQAPRPRSTPREPLSTGRYVPALSLDPVTHLRGCALATLLLVRSLADQAGRLVTLTVSLATQLGYTRRAVQYAYHELRAAGYLEHRYDAQHGVVVLELLEAVLPAPEAVQARQEERQAPTPSTGWREAWKRRVQALNAAARRGVRNAVRPLNGISIQQGRAGLPMRQLTSVLQVPTCEGALKWR